MPDITSPANPQIKHLVSLRKRSVREAAAVTLVEGYDEVSLAADAGAALTTLYWCPDLASAESRNSLLDKVVRSKTPTIRLSRAAFERASYRENPDGWLAVALTPDRALADLELGARPLVLVVEAVEKPGNLGAMLRTADAAGVDAVVAASAVADWANPNVVRASKGAVFTVPVASATTDDVVDWLRERRLTVVVATPAAAVPFTEVDLTGAVAVVVGAEHAGVSERILDAADARVAVPMAGRVNSLNVATSAALVVYEAVRQRARR